MKQIDVGIIGTGWCGGIRAVACARSALVGQLHLVETDADRLRGDLRGDVAGQRILRLGGGRRRRRPSTRS